MLTEGRTTTRHGQDYFIVTSNYTFYEWPEKCKLSDKHYEAAKLDFSELTCGNPCQPYIYLDDLYSGTTKKFSELCKHCGENWKCDVFTDFVHKGKKLECPYKRLEEWFSKSVRI